MESILETINNVSIDDITENNNRISVMVSTSAKKYYMVFVEEYRNAD